MQENKLYLILNEAISGIGGSYIYIMNKLRYYERIGYSVCYIHGGHENFPITIPYLQKYLQNKETSIRIPIFYFSQKNRIKYTKKIIKKYHLDEYSEVIIESSTYNQATWGESISSIIGAKHLVLLLTEQPVITDINAFHFLRFKLERKELCGIVEKSLPLLFSGWKDVSDNQCYYLRCRCNNSLDNVPFDWDKKLKSTDYTIGCLGRFDKPYFLPALSDLKDYIIQHPEKTFTIILIGDTKSKKNQQQINSILRGLDNSQIVKTGNLFPIPLKLIQKANVFISSAGSCRTIRLAGVNVISYDGNDLKPIGIFEKTTHNSLFRTSEDESYSLSDLLDMILVEKKFLENNPVADLKAINEVDFSIHHKFIEQSCHELNYFEFRLEKKTHTAQIASFLTSIFSHNLIMKILDTIRNKMKLNFSVEQLIARMF